MKFDDLSIPNQNKVIAKAKVDYPSAFKKQKRQTLDQKQYQLWLRKTALQSTIDEMKQELV